MDNKVNPNGVNNENEVVKKAAPPPMKRVKKGEQSAAVAKAAKTIEEKKKAASAPKVEVKEEVNDFENYVLNIDDIYYFEAVDNKVFAYTKNEVYEVNYKIHEINDLFSKTFFVQISRTVILNIDKINRVSTLVNGRIYSNN